MALKLVREGVSAFPFSLRPVGEGQPTKIASSTNGPYLGVAKWLYPNLLVILK